MNKGIIMEVKKNCAITLSDDGAMYKIKLKGDMQVGQKIYFFDDDILNNTISSGHSYRGFIKTFGSIAALFLIVFTFFHLMKPQEAYAVVSLDINPSIQIEVDSNKKIINVEGVNDDGKNIDFSDVKDIAFDNGIQKIKDKLSKYLDTNKDVLVGYAFVKNGDNGTYEEDLKDSISATFNTEKVTYLPGEKEDVDEAKTQGISLGRYEASKVVDQDIKNNIDKAPVKEITASIEDNVDSSSQWNAQDEKKDAVSSTDSKSDTKTDTTTATEKPLTSASSDSTQASTDSTKDKGTTSKTEKNNDVLEVQPDTQSQSTSNENTSSSTSTNSSTGSSSGTSTNSSTSSTSSSTSTKDSGSITVTPSSGSSSSSSSTSSTNSSTNKTKDDSSKTSTSETSKSTDKSTKN